MKQKDKDLLLKDLCARLPYGVKVKTSFNKIDEPIELKSININNCTFAVGGEYTTISGISFDTYTCKPYLFPLSSMTEEIKDEIYNNTGVYDIGIDSSVHIEVGTTFEDLTKIFDILHKHNMDYRGLIPKGLAIDATGLNIY